MKKYELLPWQKEAMMSWIENDGKGIVESPTGSGKTFLGLDSTSTYRHHKVLILVHTSALLHQWKEKMKEYLNLDVGLIGDGFSVPDENITIAIINSVRNYVSESYDLLIVDEVHHLASEENIKFLNNNVFDRILGLSATVVREDERHKLLNLPTVFKYSQEKAIDDKVLAKYKEENIPVEMIPEERMKYDQYTTFINQYYPEFSGQVFNRNSKGFNPILTRLRKDINSRKKLLLNNPLKIDKTLDLVEVNATKRILIFTEYVSMAEDISNKLNKLGYKNKTYTTRTKNQETIREFTDGVFNILIAVKCLDEGLDVKDADCVIIVGGSSVKRQQIQRVGRSLRYEKDKESMVYNLYTINTKEEDWLNKRQR